MRGEAEETDLRTYLRLWFDRWTNNKTLSVTYKYSALRLFENDELFSIPASDMASRFRTIGNRFCELLEKAFLVWSVNTIDRKSLTLTKFKYNTVCDFENLAVTALRTLKTRLFRISDSPVVIGIWREFVKEYATHSEFAARVVAQVDE